MSNEKPIEELIAASSLGTPEAVAIRKQADPDVVAQVVAWADYRAESEDAAAKAGMPVEPNGLAPWGRAMQKWAKEQEDKLWTKCETKQWPDTHEWVQVLTQCDGQAFVLAATWDGHAWFDPSGEHVEYVVAWRELADPPSWATGEGT